jgi:hypothetical protein
MVLRVSFAFSCLGSSKLYKKQNQVMETETPMMLLFVSNGDTLSITSDINQMLETAYDNIETNGMMPQEFEYLEIPTFTLKLNAP